VPRIPDEVADTVVYLYPNRESALRGERAGGSGFIVSIPSDADSEFSFSYVVTNSHVIREAGCDALRVNTRSGGTNVIAETKDFWLHHPDGDDVAVLSISLDYETTKVKALPIDDWFVTQERVEYYKIGIGDEIVMLGRFVNHEGRTRNLPAARFGNIAMLPYEPVRTPRGLLQEVFLVECRSLPGYSGSPVFFSPLPFGRSVPHAMLLGIDMGHLKDTMPVLDKKELAQGRMVPINDNWTIETNTGMSCVIPAWKIREVIYSEEMIQVRKELNEKFKEEKKKSSVSFDVAKSDTVFTQDVFEDALKKVSRKIEEKE
jgi:Trypsin-like peptidase domain